MSYAAAQRYAEMGVRAALGATAADIASLLLGSAAKLAALGIAGGLVVALLARRLIESMLFGVKLRDPLAIVGAVVLLSIAALAAALIPALRAARADPASALRQD
jgi:ABC-type antimicrobial peptide transport system permease subunit